MSYRCQITEPLASAMGVDAGPPRIACDDCGIRLYIGVHGLPPAWFLDGKAAPSWRMVKQGDVRRDYCPKCKDKEPTP